MRQPFLHLTMSRNMIFVLFVAICVPNAACVSYDPSLLSAVRAKLRGQLFVIVRLSNAMARTQRRYFTAQRPGHGGESCGVVIFCRLHMRRSWLKRPRKMSVTINAKHRSCVVPLPGRANVKHQPAKAPVVWVNLHKVTAM